tara:strand:+ start:2050 stop:2268 length:219 start_codon:yes stop_codon:yes gene_type:complete
LADVANIDNCQIVNQHKSCGDLLPFICSNGGKMASDDGQKLLLNQPAAVEALQKIRIWSIGIMWHQPPLRYN